MTETELREIERCWQNSTKGVWQVANVTRINKRKPSRVTVHAFDGEDMSGVCIARDIRYVKDVRGEGCDAELVAMAHERIPALVAEVRRLREGLARLERGDAIWGVCAVCEYDVPRGGHQPGCPLAAILAGESQLDGQKP